MKYFIDQYKPDHVLILSGDHIYKMDYDAMLQYHVEKEADVTIGVLEVTLEEASRFGIMNTDSKDRIVEFEEKPVHPKSNLASMGIYIFNWKQLRESLLNDLNKENSDHDFGKDIIPEFIGKNKRLFAYRFKGYWKDVGTIDSLWEANMDLLYHSDELNLADPDWKIYSEDVTMPPQYVGPDASVENAYITQGCIVNGTVINSVLFTGTVVEKGAVVKDSVLMPHSKVKAGAHVERAIIADDVVIGKEKKVGDAKSKIVLVAKSV